MKTFLYTPFALILLLFASCTAAKPNLYPEWNQHVLKKSEAKPFTGLKGGEGLIYYVVHHGGDLKLKLTFDRWHLEPDKAAVVIPQALFYQIYDAEEKPVKSQFYVFPEDGKTKQVDFTYSFTKAPAGIYQVRTAATAGGHIRSDLTTTPQTQYGLMPSRCNTTVGKSNLNPSFVYVPPQAKELKIYNRGTDTTVSTLDGKQLLQVKSNKHGNVKVTPGKVYKLTFTNFGSVGFDGFPVILCPDATTAENIRASVEVAPDGTLFPHKFQVRMWEWMHSLKPEQLAVKGVPPKTMRDKFRAKPISASFIAQDGALSHADYVFKHQNVDPKSDDYGDSKDYSNCAVYYSLNEDFNPYYKNSAVLNRLLLNQYRRLFDLKENGTFGTGWSNYSGGDALSTLSSYMSFMLCGKVMPAKERELWETGLGFEINRFGLTRVSCENQTAHWLVDSYCMYLGGAGEQYKQIAEFFARTASDPKLNKFIKTGYMQERYGPDGTYQGLNACNLAFYYSMSKDKNIKGSLDKIYSLFNHTVAPEPNGKKYGASNYGHRTKGSWVHRQWTGGTNLMAGCNEDAACYFRFDADSPKTKFAKYLGWPMKDGDDKWYEDNSRWVTGYCLSPWLPMWDKYYFGVKPIKNPKLPVERSKRFFKEFNKEFYCCREPSYYSVVYAGKTSYDWVKKSLKQDPLGGEGWKKEGNVYTPVSASAKKGAWCPTQGISLFWTPEYGNCIVGKNWNVYTGQFVRADLPDGKVSWPDYWTCKSSYDDTSRSLTIRNKMFRLPLETTRTISFLDNGINVDVALKKEKEADVLKTVEQLPYLAKEGTKVDFFRADGWSPEPGDDTTKIRFRNDQGQGVLIELSSPTTSAFGPSTKHFRQTMGLIELAITDSMNYKVTAIK